MEAEDQPDNRLPQRLFATDRYPCNRHNIYSSPSYLPLIRNVLRDTEEFDTIRASCFGKLFDLPARQCPVSAKLIHSLLTRQLLCVDSHTLWTVFGGYPLRFGLQEFGTITGLPCGAFPPGYNPESRPTPDPREDPFWVKVIGNKRFITIEELANKLQTDIKMSRWRKLRLALIIIVDGVLIAHEQKPRPSLRFVKMLEDLDVFFQHPWGRESFLKTINCMKPPKYHKRSCKDPPAKLVEFLKQETYRLKGFPLSLQLLAFRSVPKLLSIIQAPHDTLTIMDLVQDHLPTHPPIATLDIHTVENDPKLAVTTLIPLERQTQPGWGIWPDVFDDDKVSYMEQRIADCQPFTKSMWPGGDTSEVYITSPEEPDREQKKKRSTRSSKAAGKPLRTRHAVAKTTTSKTTTSRTQRRISKYFSRASTSSNQQEKVMDVLSNLTEQFGAFQQQFHSLTKQLARRKRQGKRSSFQTLLKSSKRCNISKEATRSQQCSTSEKGCQTDPTWINFDRAHNDFTTALDDMIQHSPSVPTMTTTGEQCQEKMLVDGSDLQRVPTMPNVGKEPQDYMDIDGTSSVSPLISQYGAQQYIQKDMPNLGTSQQSLVHKQAIHISPVHNTPIHHNQAIHISPVHITPVHDNLPIHENNLTPINNKSPLLAPDSPLYDTSALDLHAYPADASKKPPTHEVLFCGSQSQSPAAPDHITPTQPKFDSSAGPSNNRTCLFPLETNRTPTQQSPNKSSNAIHGFAVHAVGVTHSQQQLHPLHKLKQQLFYQSRFNMMSQAHGTDNEQIVELSDFEGTPPRRTPTYFPGTEEKKVAKEILQCKQIPATTLICELPQTQWDLFYNTISKFGEAFHITPSKLNFSNNFLLQLAVPTQWTKTYHMVMLMHMLSERHAGLLKNQKLCFTTPYLVSGIKEMYPRFSRSRKKTTLNWDRQLSEIVLMPGNKWMEDVTTVYTPMIWADKHWVGLAINLDLGLVEILDPMVKLYSDSKVERFMNPVLKSLPYLVKKVAKYELTQFRKLEPFTWTRIKDNYCNERSGDCGPVSVKFMEMHSHADPDPCMSGITDNMVDAFRKQYVLDLYKTIVLPTYYK